MFGLGAQSNAQTNPFNELGALKPPMLSRDFRTTNDSARTRYRDEAAAPPTYLLLLVYVPLGAAIFISGSRYFNYRHHGFDIISGALIGIVTSWFSFRWYHLPVGQGSGWSWGPRSASKAFGVGVGSHGYVDEEDVGNGGVGDVEMGHLSRERVRGQQLWSDDSTARLRQQESSGH